MVFWRLLIAVTLLFTVLATAVDAQTAPDFTDREKRILESLSLASLKPLPPNPSNKLADNKRAAELGEALFFDGSLSKFGSLSCASCHQPDRAYTDGKALAEGVSLTARNTPPLQGVAYQRWYYWDGRRDSLWSQALIPFEAPSEMGSSRLAVVREVLSDPDYLQSYKVIFGAPPSINFELLPDHATPIGAPALQNKWYRLNRSVQKKINAVFANLGKSLEAFQRRLDPPVTRFDQFVDAMRSGDGERAGLLASAEEKRGMKLFMDDKRTQCLRCHNGPMLTNGGFHNIGTGKFSGKNMDFGRVFGLQAVQIDQFNCLGDYSDARPEQCNALNHFSQDAHQTLHGAFKTPTLRFLEKSAPYFHDGRFSSLTKVMKHYQTPPDTGPNKIHELQPMDLSAQEIAALISFLEMLN